MTDRTPDTDGFYECLNIENDEFQSVYDGSDRSELDSSGWNNSYNMSLPSDGSLSSGSDSGSGSGRSRGSSDVSSARLSVTMYGNAIKFDVPFSDAAEVSYDNSRGSEGSGMSTSTSEGQLSHMSQSQMDEGDEDDNGEDASDNVDMGIPSNDTMVTSNRRKRMVHDDINDNDADDHDVHDNAKTKTKKRVLISPSKSLFSGDLSGELDVKPSSDLKHEDDSTPPRSNGNTRNLIGGRNRSILTGDAQDEDVQPSIRRRRQLPDVDADEQSLFSNSTTDSSVDTADSFQSVLSDMSKLRSLIRGDMVSVASNSHSDSRSSHSSASGVEIHAARLIAEELAKIEAQEKAAQLIADAETFLKAELAAENKVKKEIEKLKDQLETIEFDLAEKADTIEALELACREHVINYQSLQEEMETLQAEKEEAEE